MAVAAEVKNQTQVLIEGIFLKIARKRLLNLVASFLFFTWKSVNLYFAK